MMNKPYIHFTITLQNGSDCNVSYCKLWSGNNQMKNQDGTTWSYRADHFEFRDNLYISETGYKSHFIQCEYDDEFDPKSVAVKIANGLADFTKDIVALKSEQLPLM